MKKITISILLFLVIINTTAQSFNTEIKFDEKKPELLGKINKEALLKKNYNEWFLKGYESYKPNQAILAKIKPLIQDFTIKAFMGTWCGDSKKEIPRFYKILDELNFPLDRLTLVALSRESNSYKQSPGGEQEGLTIHRVPTFIFYKDGIEINRIVESPKNLLEEDILHIIQNDYQPNYISVQYVDHYLKNNGLKKFIKKSKRIAKKIKPQNKNFWELNTYSNVLFSANKKQEAIAIARLNLQLYNENPDAYIRLAFKLNKINKKEEALQLLKKAEILNPKNKKIKEYLKQIQDKV
ncbi:MAG: hypothetical protein ACWA45_04680 [Flavobacteriales bacterium]